MIDIAAYLLPALGIGVTFGLLRRPLTFNRRHQPTLVMILFFLTLYPLPDPALRD
jgi:hypothetical protein